MTEIIRSTQIPESYSRIRHSSGLEILLYPMDNYNGSYALFSTKYGSVDTIFKTDKEPDFVKVPEGIAHFLEHKLFESEKGDAFARYAKTGASANAYTSFDRTAYLFSCTDNFNESLEILLDFVTDPYFTPETVEKEQGIISQEIKMYQDDPDWRVFFGLLGGLYKNNPVSIDIAGTVDSIAQIDADILYRCYNTFYNLHNMVLVIAGNFDQNKVLELADKILKPADKIVIEHKTPPEDETVNKTYVEISLPVALPLFQVGFKSSSTGEKEDFIQSIKLDILLEMISGKASPLYNKLYKKGIINSTFSASSESGRGYFYSAFGGESRDPKAVQSETLKEIELIKKTGLDADAFDHCRKASWGRYVSAYGSVTGVASLVLSAHFAGLNAYAALETVENVQLEELEALLHSSLNPEQCVLSVVNSNIK